MWHQMASELTGACTCATGTSNVRATRASNPSQTDLWYQMAGSGSHERETAPQGYDGTRTSNMTKKK